MCRIQPPKPIGLLSENGSGEVIYRFTGRRQISVIVEYACVCSGECIESAIVVVFVAVTYFISRNEAETHTRTRGPQLHTQLHVVPALNVVAHEQEQEQEQEQSRLFSWPQTEAAVPARVSDALMWQLLSWKILV